MGETILDIPAELLALYTKVAEFKKKTLPEVLIAALKEQSHELMLERELGSDTESISGEPFPRRWGPKAKEALAKWRRHRTQIRHPLKPLQIKAIFKDFGEDPRAFFAAVEHSVRNGYQGLFCERNQKSNLPPKELYPDEAWVAACRICRAAGRVQASRREQRPDGTFVMYQAKPVDWRAEAKALGGEKLVRAIDTFTFERLEKVTRLEDDPRAGFDARKAAGDAKQEFLFCYRRLTNDAPAAAAG